MPIGTGGVLAAPGVADGTGLGKPASGGACRGDGGGEDAAHPEAGTRRRMNIVGKAIAVGEALGALSIGGIAVVIVYDVAARALGYPALWSMEVSGYLMLAGSVLAAGAALGRGGHFAVRFLVDGLPPRAVRVIDLVADLAGLAFVAAMTWGCAVMMARSHALGMVSPTLLRVPVVWPQAVLLCGLGLLCLAWGLRIAGRFRRGAAGR